MRFSTVDDVIIIHEEIIARFGAATGVLNSSSLESAVSAPRQTFADFDPYPTIAEKAAVLLVSLIRNHPFVDGNKRTALLAMLRFLHLNGITLEASNDDVFELCLAVATSTMDREDISVWIKERTIVT